MNIFAISVIKNEADVISHNLSEASKWAHKIFVLDNGSEDGTWEIVQEMKSEKIIPWKSESKPFYEGLRGEVYREFKHEANEGDWWCFRLDADEFYVDDPNLFLKEIPIKYQFVCTETFEYQLTIEDLEEFEFEGKFPEDLNKIQYYLPTTWSEARFFRHRDKLNWEKQRDRPFHIGIVYPKKIQVKHYQYRSQKQIEKRLKTRVKARNEGFKGWEHASQNDWKSKLLARNVLAHDSGEYRLKSLSSRNNHLHSPLILFIKRILYFLKLVP